MKNNAIEYVKDHIFETYEKIRERYEFMIDHCSYSDNLRSCEMKAWKKNIQAWTELLWTPVQTLISQLLKLCV